MAPGIMFLAGSPPTDNPPVLSDPRTDLSSEASPKSEDVKKASSPRADSPGYFTLSDSDGASNPGTESSLDDDGNRPPQTIYRMFKTSQMGGGKVKRMPKKGASLDMGTARFQNMRRSSSSEEATIKDRKSTTPPRPSPPKAYKRESVVSTGSNISNRSGGSPPPRPPPPLKYTSTLPPPVPKKAKMGNSKTLPRRSSQSMKQSKSLNKIQPLQVQSPSIVQALNNQSKPNVKPSTSSTLERRQSVPPQNAKLNSKQSKEQSIVGPKTFVQTFKSANANAKLRNVQARVDTGLSHHRTDDNRSPSKASSIKSRSPSITSLSSETKGSTSPIKSGTPTPRSRQSSMCSEASLRTNRKKSSNQNIDKSGKNVSSSIKNTSIPTPTSKTTPAERKETKCKKTSTQTRTSKSLTSTCIDKIKAKASTLRSSSPKSDPSGKGETEIKKYLFSNPIHGLVKNCEAKKGCGDTDDDDTSTKCPSSARSSHLSQISLMSAEKINSWLSNPSSNDSKDLSYTEIDVLDQYISQMISFTQDTLTDIQTPRSSIGSQSEAFISLLEKHRNSSDSEEVRHSVQEIISKLEAASDAQPPPVPPKKRRTPTATPPPPPSVPVLKEPDLNHGVFTEVTYAGSFSHKPPVASAPKPVPVPSPRTKRKARKELMLLEHKENGKEALNKLKELYQPPPDPGPKTQSNVIYSNFDDSGGMECLNELCQISQSLEMKIITIDHGRPTKVVTQSHESENNGEMSMCNDRLDDHEKDAGCQEILFNDQPHRLLVESRPDETTIGDFSVRNGTKALPDSSRSEQCTPHNINNTTTNNKVFLRAGVLAHLQEERDEKLTDQVVRFQALCRGHLARKRFQRRKTQDIAIRCIQKNVRKFMGVRDWPWWRLLVKLTPLLNVHRTEDQLKSRTEELEVLKARLEKVEKERADFKQANEKLENRLSEMTADLAEEHSTATLATERLEAEQAERLKLEKEKSELTSRNKHLLQSNERMEMEVLYSRALDMNGAADSDEDGEPSIFKQKYERAIKELEFTKKRLAQQHDDDMEQLMALKKQLEKKLHDAFDEVDEQRQNVAQWKRKAQKAQGEMNDTKLLLEEQTSRNLLLEKKQRKFDAEINSLQEDRKQEKAAKDKLYRELDDIKRIKYSLEDEITAMKLDLDYKDEKISALSKELEDLHSGGTTDEEVSSLKRQKNDLEKRLKDQEEELDDMAGQVQMLEQAKIKLEMSMAALKKDHRREISSKEDELEDARNAAMKKVKALEQQLESEHEERIGFVREKHELETKIINLQDLASRSTDEDVVAKLKKDLKRTKALLKDAQYMLERSRNETSNKSVIRQLKNQLEDAEFARISAIKAKQNTDLELSDVQQQLEDVMRSKSDVEDKLFRIGREKADLATQLEDNDSELSEVMKKYKASVGQLSVDQITIHEQANAISDLEEERNQLKEQLAEFTAKVQSMEGENVSTAQHHRLELKIKELESKLDLEQTTRGRMETQINRLKEAIDKINIECDQLRAKEHSAQELVRKLQRQLRDLKEEFTNLQAKETEVNSKKNELEKMLELAEAETVTAKNDLKLAMKRIEDLQTAMNGEIDSDSDSILSDGDSDSSDDDVSNIYDRRASHLTRGSISRTLEPMPEEPESQLNEGKSRRARYNSDSDEDQPQSSGKPSQPLLDDTDRTGESQA